MKKKIILRYFLLSLPFVVGSILFGLGIFNLLSSLLFFVGGYIVVKNTFDYRKIKKNIDLIKDDDENITISKGKKKYKSYDSIPCIKRTIRHSKVRRRIKY